MLRPVHTMLKKIGNEGLTLKMLSVHTALEDFQNATITNHFAICGRGKLGQKNHVVILTSSMSKNSVLTRKRTAGVFKFLRFEERFRKAPFS